MCIMLHVMLSTNYNTRIAYTLCVKLGKKVEFETSVNESCTKDRSSDLKYKLAVLHGRE